MPVAEVDMKLKLIILNLLSTQIFAFSPANLLKRVHFPPQLSQDASEIYFDKDGLDGSLRANPDLLKKADRIARFLHAKVPIRRSKIRRLVAFIDLIRSETTEGLGAASLYVPQNRERPFSIQIYSNGHTYINLEDADPEKKKGGYKRFARALDYDNELLYAHLRAEVKDFYNLKKQIKELEFMESLSDSPETINFRDTDIYVAKEGEELKNTLSIHTELYDNDLRIYKAKWKTPRTLLTLLYGVTKALHEMHRHSIVHRDLKAANYFVRERDGRLHIVLADFGLSQSPDDPRFGLNLCGTRGFMAPESCQRWASRRSAFANFDEGKAADVFSLGMVFREILWGDRESPDSNALTKLNYAALPPKNSDKGVDLKEVDERFEGFVTAHEAAFPHLDKASPAAKCIFSLDALSWRILAPHADERPTTGEILQILEDLDTSSLCS